ncbi:MULTISPECIES: hypothetical protein [unclassified Exiguobacterium]|uniref:hypothetical protein n=1 Tax=unclassified Exiguobacterium TaxID=2644629 RepID=UPI001BE82583|nr:MULTISPECIES: hypothetical protein [unclassified Exiguobacterium]
MNREGLIHQLNQVKQVQEMLDKKEELLLTMKSIALEAANTEATRRIVLNHSFQDLQSQLSYLESEIMDSFREILNNSIE